jgi:triphosphoribosyl-dephospho-CoA synthase
MDSEKIGLAVEMACLFEVSADKPGNVTRHEDFVDTSFEDFLISAAAIGPAFRSTAKASVGEIILQAIRATRNLVRVNTNLGIVLLLAPLAKAAELSPSVDLQTAVESVLQNLTVEDTQLTYQAIRLAKPAGMGTSQRYDLNKTITDITLLQAMEEARNRDAISREYVTTYNITFAIGLVALKKTLAQSVPLPEAIVQTFLSILAEVPDTLIARKNGEEVAQQISNRAKRIIKEGGIFGDKGEIQKFDFDLRDKKHSLNPGTTADLIAAVLFAYFVEEDFSPINEKTRGLGQ